jgi:hypothetical protein
MPKKGAAKSTGKEVVTAPEPSVVGRPTAFTDEMVEQARFLCHRGATDTDLAEFFGVTERTINRWKVAHPEFSSAMVRGKEAADDRVVDRLYHKAMGIEYEEAVPIKLKDVLYENGKRVSEKERIEVVMVKKVIPPDTTAMIFWLKNRRKDEWRDVHQLEHGRPGDFDQMSTEELKEYIRGEVLELKIVPELSALPAPETRKPARRGNGKH